MLHPGGIRTNLVQHLTDDEMKAMGEWVGGREIGDGQALTMGLQGGMMIVGISLRIRCLCGRMLRRGLLRILWRGSILVLLVSWVTHCLRDWFNRH